MTATLTPDTITEEQVWEETTIMPPVPCELEGHYRYGDGPAQYRAILHHDECGRHDLTLMCEACLIVLANATHTWVCIRCDGYVAGNVLVRGIARLLGRA